VTLAGQFAAGTVLVLMVHQRMGAQPPITPSAVTSGSVSFAIPNTHLRVELHAVGDRSPSAGGVALQNTLGQAIALAPTIPSPTSAKAATNSSGYINHIDLQSAGLFRAKIVSLALGGTTVPAQSFSAPTTTLSFQFFYSCARRLLSASASGWCRQPSIGELVGDPAEFYRAIYNRMIETETILSWVDANQAYLVAQFLAPQGQAGSQRRRVPGRTTEEMRAALETPPAIDRLCEVFNLSSFERDVLLLCAGVEMDSELAALCGSALRPPPTGLRHLRSGDGDALAEPHWSALTPGRPLRHFRLVELEPGHGLASAPMRIDERICHYLAGVNALDPRLEPVVRLCRFPNGSPIDHKLVAVQALQLLASHSPDSPVLHLCGDDPQGQEDTATLVAQATNRHLFTLTHGGSSSAGF